MIATFLALKVLRYAMMPRLQFDIELFNESNEHHAWIYGWTGDIFIQQPQHMLIGNLSTDFGSQHLGPLAKTKIAADCEIGHEKLDILEDLRRGANWQMGIILKLLFALIPKTAPAPYDISLIRSEQVSVQSSTGDRLIEIPRSVWDDKLQELNYGSILTLRFTFPPPPLGTQLDKSLEFLRDAQKKISDGEWADSLASCRKSIDELQKLCGNDEEKRKAFFQSMLGDEKKAEACEDLWQAIQKAKNFASGGPHTYWVKTADKRDAELAIRVASAFVNYFASNLARALAS
jgi:hypothetical protein